MSSVTDLFLKLISYDTQSSESSSSAPSTPTQLDFAKNVLYDECVRVGLSDVVISEHGVLFATLSANIADEAANISNSLPTVGFIAHMDTSPDSSGKNIKPQIKKNYDGGDIALNEARTLSPKEFPTLKNYIGQDLIVTDGTTLLGADDKAGIAEILCAMEYLSQNPSIKHGRIRVAFTPDEEIGRGVDHFDVNLFDADFAFTIDGGELGELECQSFNAARAVIKIEGKSVHPGSAKNIMINASLIAAEFIERLPKDETPAATENMDGFYHLLDINGRVEDATLQYLIRDFDKENFEKRKAFILNLVCEFNKKYDNIVSVTLRDEYYNMYEILKSDENQKISAIAKEAMRAVGVKPVLTEVRGGTDGSRLSFMGLPCPNLFGGGHNFHGPYEFIPIQSMQKATEVIQKICALIPQKF